MLILCVFARVRVADLMLVEILVALGSVSLCLIIITVFCYKKRQWYTSHIHDEESSETVITLMYML